MATGGVGPCFYGVLGPVAKIKSNKELQILQVKETCWLLCNSQSKAISHLQQEIDNCGVISCKQKRESFQLPLAEEARG